MPVHPPADLGTPEHLTALYDRVARLERRKHSGFDPNEDPVIIGAAATAGGGSTPDNVSGGATGAVAIGSTATCLATSGVAIGDSAYHDGGNGVSIGQAAHVDCTYGVAIGYTANCIYDNSTAIGMQATADAIDQVMLGSDSATVVCPGKLEVRGTSVKFSLPTVNPGISGHLWNNSGVVTVSP